MADDKTRPDPAAQEGVPRNDFETLHGFMLVMWEKLKKNAHKGGWSQTPLQVLSRRIVDEKVELDLAWRAFARLLDTDCSEQELCDALQRVRYEAADTANFAMMLADRAVHVYDEEMVRRGKRD